ncbi:MAG: TolC family protein [Pseudomonadota bacterium]
MRHPLTAVLSLVVGAAFVSASQAQESGAPVLPLEEVVSLALDKSPKIGEARANVQGADAAVDESRAALMPRVGLSLNVDRATLNSASPVSARPVLDFSVLDPSLGVVPVNEADKDMSGFTRYSGGVDAEWVLYDFGQRSGVVDSRSADLASTMAREEVTEGETVVRVTERYFGLLRAQAFLTVREDFVKRKEESLALAERLKRAGRGTAGDVARARSELAQARLDHIEAENEVERQKVWLKQAMGIDMSMEFDIDPESRLKPPDHWLAMALENQDWARHHPRAVSSLESLKARRAEIDAQRASYLPTIRARANYRMDKYQDAPSAPNYTVGLELKWTLFEGGARNARVRQAQSERAAANARRRQVVQKVIADEREAEQDLRVAAERIEMAGEALSAAREDLRNARAGYNEGVRAFSELSDAQIGVREAEVRLAAARFDRQTALAKLYWALGRLPMNEIETVAAQGEYE